MKNIPNIRILRKEVYVEHTFWQSGHTSIRDYIQYKDGDTWIDVPVENEYTYIDTSEKNKRILGNY